MCFESTYDFQDPWVQASEVSKGLVLPTVTPSDPLGKFLPPDPATLSSVGIEVLVPEGSTLLLEVTIHFGNSDFPLASLVPLSQQTTKEITVLGGAIDPGYRGEIGLLLHTGNKKHYLWGAGESSGCLLVLPL